MCNLTISSILQKPTKHLCYRVHAYISGDEAGLNSARVHLECVLSLHDSAD